MSPSDQFLQSQLPSILQPGEQVLHTAYMRRQPGILIQALFALLAFLVTKAYFAVLTDRRLILIRTKMSFWSFSGAPRSLNLGVEEYDVRTIQQVTLGGFANNRSMTFVLNDGRKETLRISPWFKAIAGTARFFEEVPKLIASGQLAGGGAPQQLGQPAPGALQGTMPSAGALPAYGAPQQQAQGYGAPQQQAQGYGAPQPQAQAGFAPGSHVMVVWQDGNRYPATVVQMQNGHYLCAMQDGQQHWVPPTHVVAS